MQQAISQFAQWYAALAIVGGAGGVAQFFYTELYQASPKDEHQSPRLGVGFGTQPKDQLVVDLLSRPEFRRLIVTTLFAYWEWRKLMLMHFLIGALGALVAVPFGIRFLDLDLSKIGNASSFDEVAKPGFLLVGLAALGGFAGARMLTTMSMDLINKMIDKKADKSETASLGERSKELEAKSKDLQSAQTKFEAASFELEIKTLLQGADINVLTHDYHEAVRKGQRFFELCKQRPDYVRPKDKVIAWNILGRAHKRLGEYGKAIDYIDECLRQADLSQEHRAKMLFNKACYMALAFGKTKASPTAGNSPIQNVVAILKDPCIKGYITKSDIVEERDFDAIANDPVFVQFVNTFGDTQNSA